MSKDEQGRPILENFRKQNPDWKILLTFFSPSGYEIRKSYAQADCIVYLPLDTPRNARKLIQIVKPQIAVFIKYEFWYNYLNTLKKQGVRTFFVSAIFRPKQYFFKSYGFWFRKQLSGVEHFFVQNKESEKLLHSIGFQNVSLAGDTRFDRVSEIPQNKKTFPIIESFKGNKKLCIVGSSWISDEKKICEIISEFPNFKFLFVPHEIDEAHLQSLEQLLSQPSLRYSKAEGANVSDIQVMIVDQIGFLSQLYSYADIAYIGGGFQKSGIHNVLEAAVFGMPIVFGTNYSKFQEARDLVELNVAKSISSSEELVPILKSVESRNAAYLLACEQSKNYVMQKKGATTQILQSIGKRLSILACALFFSLTSFAQMHVIDEHDHTLESDTTALTDSLEDESIVKKEGGSLNRGEVYYFYENPIGVGIPTLRFIDTSRSLFHREEPYLRNNIFRVDRGNNGMITEELEYRYHDNILFSYGKAPFDLYRYTYSNTEFYQNVQPYAELFYEMGKEKEQNFRALFAQNVIRGLNVGAEFNVINSPGVYTRMFTRHNNIRAFANYISKNKHYRAVAGYYHNKIDVNENGGITIPADSLQYMPSNLQLIPIKYQQAENSWRENSFYVKQSYRLGFGRKDSIPNSGINLGYLSHSLEITRYRTMYADNQLVLDNYSAILRDSARTFDSTYVGLFRNTFSWNIGDVTTLDSSRFLNLSVGAIHETAKVTSDSVYSKNYNYLYPFAKLRLNYRNKYIVSAGLTLLMDNTNDISANAQFHYAFDRHKPTDGLFAEVNYSDVRPRPFQTNYVGNHYAWDTSFDNMKTLNFAVGARWKGFLLKGEMTTFTNYTYLSTEHFAQADESFSIIKASLEKTFKVGILAWDTRFVMQLRPTGYWFQLPKFSTRNALYFDFLLLGITPLQIGVEGYYNTPYLSRFYNPVLGSFYGQGDVETGGFVYIDAFLNMRVQRANLFFKFCNIGAQWLGYDYIMTYGYPTVPRAFKFGVLWRFYD